MKKYLLLSSFVVLSVSLSGCSLMNSVSGKADAAAKQSREQAANELKEALASGKPAQCGTISTIAGVKTESRLYIDPKGNRSRTISTITFNGKTQTSNGLKLKDRIYSWNEGAKEGFYLSIIKPQDLPAVKKPAPQTKPAAPAPSPMSQEDIDKFSAQINTNCEAWVLDEAMFKLPKDVKFVDQMVKLQEMKDKAQAALDAAKAKQNKKK